MIVLNQKSEPLELIIKLNNILKGSGSGSGVEVNYPVMSQYVMIQPQHYV